MTVEKQLDKIFLQQKTFQQMLQNDIYSKEFLKEMFLGLHCEVSEALQCFNWKGWKKDVKVDTQHLREEFADIFLFMTNIMLALDIDIYDLLNDIEEKQQKNIQRQQSDY